MSIVEHVVWSLFYISDTMPGTGHTVETRSADCPDHREQVFLGGRPPAVNHPTCEKILTVKEAHRVSTRVRGNQREPGSPP